MNFGRFTHRRQRRPLEDGYILLWILLMMFFMSMALMSAATSVVQQMRRDREEEMIHRGVQYARAIQKYVRKFGRNPANLEQLENTNNIRFLRQRYKDPMSPNGEWHLIRQGELQLIQGAIGGGPTGSVSSFGQPSGSSFGQSSGSSFGQSSGSSFGQPSGSSFGQPSGTLGSPSGDNAGQAGTVGLSTPSSSSQVFGGGIIGVSSTSEKQGIREFNGKNHYKEWLFIYDPTMELTGGVSNTGTRPLIMGPYQPPKQQLLPGMQTPGSTQQPGSSIMR